MFSFAVIYTFSMCSKSPDFYHGNKKNTGSPKHQGRQMVQWQHLRSQKLHNEVLKGFWNFPPTFLEILLRKLSTNVSLDDVTSSAIKDSAFHPKICNMSHQEFPQSCVSIRCYHWTSVEKVYRTHRSNDIDPEPG